jgi:hypothetical protein
MINRILALLFLTGSAYASAPLSICQAPAVCPNYASGIGALPLTGGTVTGNLAVTGTLGATGASTLGTTGVSGTLSATGAGGASVTYGLSVGSFTVSGPALFNVVVATQAAGAAGAAVTVNCPANTYVMYGGCNCTSTAVGTTTIIFNGPGGTWTAGASATAQTSWKCQSADSTTGQTCAAFVQCASIGN